MKEIKNVLSTFGGIECGKIALDRAGVAYKRYYSSEIDKYAIIIANKNHDDIIQLGDIQFVTGQQFDDVGGIDLLMGGSPCQGFSFAGNQLNFKDSRSALFFEFIRLKNELNPKYFLLENVKMKKEYQNIISEYMGCEPIEINSALVSAQNRKRLYWTNIPNIEQPEDKGILLKDVLFDNCVNLYQRPRGNNNGGVRENKSPCMSSNSWEQNVLAVKDKSQAILATIYKENAKSMLKRKKYGLLCKKLFNTNPSGNSMNGWVYDINFKSPTVTTNKGEGSKISDSKYYFRKLIPIECERLQTLPDNYTEGVSNTQRYKALGNGWTVDVIAHIFKNI